MADGSSRITRMDPDDPEKVLINTESHIENAEKAADEASERDFWLNQDFTMISEAEEAENRILSPDSESVLKSAAVADKGNTFRGSRVAMAAGKNAGADAGTGRTVTERRERLGDTKDSIEVRKALASQQRQAAAQHRQTGASRPAGSQTGTSAGQRRTAAQNNFAKTGGTKTAAGVRKLPPSDRTAAQQKKADLSRTAVGVKKITPPARSTAAPARKSATQTAVGVRRIPQTEERARAARESRIRTYKKERSAKIRKVIINIVAWILVIALCIGAFYLGYRLFNDIPVDTNDISKITVSISGLENDEEMADFLEEYDLINDKFLYKIRCKIYDADYQEGTYKLSRSYTTEKIINILSGFKAYADGTLEED